MPILPYHLRHRTYTAERFKNIFMEFFFPENISRTGRMSCIKIIELSQLTFLFLFTIKIRQFLFCGDMLPIDSDCRKRMPCFLVQFSLCCIRMLLQILSTIRYKVLRPIKSSINVIHLDIIPDSSLRNVITLGVLLYRQ